MSDLVFNMCNECDKIDDGFGILNYEEMEYSKKDHTFVCSRGHKEDFLTHFRHCGKGELIGIISKLLRDNGK